MLELDRQTQRLLDGWADKQTEQRCRGENKETIQVKKKKAEGMYRKYKMKAITPSGRNIKECNCREINCRNEKVERLKDRAIISPLSYLPRFLPCP